MSAWLCSQEHINTLVAYARENDVSLHPAANDDPEGLVRILVEENMRSLRAAYPGRDFLQEWEDDAKAIKYKRILKLGPALRKFRCEPDQVRLYGPPPTMSATTVATQMVKLCQCYDYQACETDDYRDTPAAAFIDRLRSKAFDNGGLSEGDLYQQLMWGI